jgi:GH24 family phage-related lysozyme (muramidase)
MRASQTLIDAIKKFESCVLTAYQDSVGVWTIGYGHT